MLGKITLKRVVSLIGREADKYQNNSIKYFAVTKFVFFLFSSLNPLLKQLDMKHYSEYIIFNV